MTGSTFLDAISIGSNGLRSKNELIVSTLRIATFLLLASIQQMLEKDGIMTTKLLVRPGRHLGVTPVMAVLHENGLAIELGYDAIDCTVYLSHSEAERLAKFILTEQHDLDVSTPSEHRGRHETPIRRKDGSP